MSRIIDEKIKDLFDNHYPAWLNMKFLRCQWHEDPYEGAFFRYWIDKNAMYSYWNKNIRAKTNILKTHDAVTDVDNNSEEYVQVFNPYGCSFMQRVKQDE